MIVFTKKREGNSIRSYLFISGDGAEGRDLLGLALQLFPCLGRKGEEGRGLAWQALYELSWPWGRRKHGGTQPAQGGRKSN